jgi:hypothetical protein
LVSRRDDLEESETGESIPYFMICEHDISYTATMSLPATMKAVVFDGPYKVSVQQRPVPKSEIVCLLVITFVARELIQTSTA